MVLKRNKEKSEFLFLDVRFKMVTIHRVQQFLCLNRLHECLVLLYRCKNAENHGFLI